MKSKNCVSLVRIFNLAVGLLLIALAAPVLRAQVQFSGPKNYPVGTMPVAATVGDFNGDGKQDLAVVNSGSGNVSILLGNGDGTFQPAVNYSVSSSPTFAAVGDFNGDGKLDLVVANGSANTVSILVGNGDGSFQPPVQYSVGVPADYTAVADFNGDGKPDLLASSGGSQGTVSILLGNGDATFQPAVITSVPASGLKQLVGPFVAIVDFNGDGHLDVATAEASGNIEIIGGSLIILLGRGDGTFQPPAMFRIADLLGASSVAKGDFNRDGKVDLAVAATTGIFIMLGNGDGTFSLAPNPQNPVHGGYGFADSSLAVADLNSDGRLDIVALSTGVTPGGIEQFTIQWILGKGDGTFQGPVGNVNPCTQSSDCILLSFVPNSLVLGDFHGDSVPDLVVANNNVPFSPMLANSVSIFLNTGPPPPPPDFSLSSTPTSATVTAGGSATYKLSITPANGFNKTIALSCTGAPALATCSVSPPSVSPNGTSAATATVTLTTTAPTMTAPRGPFALPPFVSVPPRNLWITFAALLLLVVAASWARRGGDHRSPLQVRRRKLALALALATVLVWVGCGGGPGPTVTHSSGTPAGTYALTLTGSSGSLSNSTTVSVTVNP